MCTYKLGRNVYALHLQLTKIMGSVSVYSNFSENMLSLTFKPQHREDQFILTVQTPPAGMTWKDADLINFRDLR